MATCSLCGTDPVAVVLQVEYRAGDGFALAQEVHVCTRCHELVESRSLHELADRLTDDYEFPGPLVVAGHLADRASHPAPWVEPASTVEGRERGFVPLSSLTGVVAALGPLWPAEHRLSRAELGDVDVDPEDAWLVRSPWPSMSVGQVLGDLWRHVEREPYPYDSVERDRRVRTFFENGPAATS